MAGISARGRRIALRPKLRPKLYNSRRNRHGTTQRKRFRPGLTPELMPELMSFSHKNRYAINFGYAENGARENGIYESSDNGQYSNKTRGPSGRVLD